MRPISKHCYRSGPAGSDVLPKARYIFPLHQYCFCRDRIFVLSWDLICKVKKFNLKKLIFHGNWSDQDPIPRWMTFWSRSGFMIRKQTDPDPQHCLYQYGVSYCHAMSVSLLPCGIWSPGIYFGKFLATLLFLISLDFNSVKNIFYESVMVLLYTVELRIAHC